MGAFRTWFRRGRIDRDLDRELLAHLDLHTHHLIAAGLTPEEARRRAHLDLGGVSQTKERVRESRAGAWLEGLMDDGRD